MQTFPEIALPASPLDLITNYREWRQFCIRKPIEQPPLLTENEYKRLSSGEQANYNNWRNAYHQSFGPIMLPFMEARVEEGVQFALNNLYAPPTARPGIIFDGDGWSGKTTTALQIALKYEAEAHRRWQKLLGLTEEQHIDPLTGLYPYENERNLFIPVVIAQTPSSGSSKSILANLNMFLGLDITKTDSEDTLRLRFESHALELKTSLVILDDIHNLRPGNVGSEKANKLQKEISNTIPFTPLYTGINARKTFLLMDQETDLHYSRPDISEEFQLTPQEKKKKKKPEKREPELLFSQTQSRLTIRDFAPMAYDYHLGVNSTWRSILATFNRHLVLRQLPSGYLDETRIARYLYCRTGGKVGSLSQLLRNAAFQAVFSGTETFTRILFDSITLDVAAENFNRRSIRTLSALKRTLTDEEFGNLVNNRSLVQMEV